MNLFIFLKIQNSFILKKILKQEKNSFFLTRIHKSKVTRLNFHIFSRLIVSSIQLLKLTLEHRIKKSY